MLADGGMIYNFLCQRLLQLRRVHVPFKGKWQSCYYHFRKNPCSLKRFNWIATFWCLFTIVSVWLCGISLVLPHAYKDSNDWVWMSHQIFANLLGLELLVNWLCIRYVDSGYVPKLHGSKPEPQMATLYAETGKGGTKHRGELGDTYDNRTMTSTLNGTIIPMQSSSTTVSGHSNDDPERNSKEGDQHIANGSPPTMYVLSGFQEQNGSPQRIAYPYWSWVPCIICNHHRPPRCQHCTLCGKCVLKRDHHCFFAGSCVGYRNMRHFTVFCLWGTIGCIYAFIHGLPYYSEVMYPHISLLDLLPYVVHVRWLLGYTDLMATYAITMLWSLFFFVPLTAHFLYLNICMLIQGQTTFERDSKLKVRDCRPLIERIYSVFGHYWMFNIIVPLHHWFDVVEDPVYWPHIKP